MNKLFLLLFLASGLLQAASITTSVSCWFDGQTVNAVNSCGFQDDWYDVRASSAVDYTVSGNMLSVSFIQTALTAVWGNPAAPLGPYDGGNVEADGSIQVQIKASGSGTGLYFVENPSLEVIDNAGVGGGELNVAAPGLGPISCGVYLGCYGLPGPGYRISFPLGTVLNFQLSESTSAAADNGSSPGSNPITDNGGTTTVQFLFYDANGDPVDVTEVPEPASLSLLAIGMVLAGLTLWKSRGIHRVPLSRVFSSSVLPLCSRSGLILPRIKERHAEIGKILLVARDKREVLI